MTKKDFELIASVFKLEQHVQGDETTRKRLAWTLCERIAAENPRFDRARFLKACGVGE